MLFLCSLHFGNSCQVISNIEFSPFFRLPDVLLDQRQSMTKSRSRSRSKSRDRVRRSKHKRRSRSRSRSRKMEKHRTPSSRNKEPTETKYRLIHWVFLLFKSFSVTECLFSATRKRSRSSSSSNSDSDAGSRRLRLGRSNKLSEVERLAEIERQRAAQNARIM